MPKDFCFVPMTYAIVASGVLEFGLIFFGLAALVLVVLVPESVVPAAFESAGVVPAFVLVLKSLVQLTDIVQLQKNSY